MRLADSEIGDTANLDRYLSQFPNRPTTVFNPPLANPIPGCPAARARSIVPDAEKIAYDLAVNQPRPPRHIDQGRLAAKQTRKREFLPATPKTL
ncbi:MAG: hypothetical protein ACREFR_17880 [Limisphaerales bacterium]